MQFSKVTCLKQGRDYLVIFILTSSLQLLTSSLRKNKTLIHTLPVSAAHVQPSKNNRFCRYYVMFGRNDRSVLVGKIPVFMRKY